jgi:colicin import membrane protein
MALPLGHAPIAAAALQGGPGWRPPQDERRWPGVLIAVLAHLGLALALALTVKGQVRTEVAIEAEVWSEIPLAAGPVVPLSPPPVPEPVKPFAPRPEPVLSPRPPTEVKPDIVTERTPTKKVVKAVDVKAPPKEPRRVPPKEPLKEPLKEPRKQYKPHKETFDTTPPKLKTNTKTGAKPDPKADKQSTAERDALRQVTLAKMMAELGGTGGAGHAPVSAGPSKSYIGRLIARIKPNINFPDLVSGNPLVQVEVRCAPDGRIVSRKVLVSSGIAVWDEAVLRALDRTEVLPLSEQGRIEPVMLLDFRPKDF